MAIRLLIFVIQALAGAAYAGDTKGSQTSTTVWSQNPEAARPFFPGATDRVLDTEDEKKRIEKSGYLMPSQRNALFNKLKLENALRGLDELDKDMLVMRARILDVGKLRTHYPTLTEDQLRKLQAELKAMKK